MSSTELLLFVSLLCLWALVRVVRKFLKNSLIFWGMAILYDWKRLNKREFARSRK